MTINPLNLLIKETESGFLRKQPSYVLIAWEMARKPLHFVRRGRILLRCGSASRVTAALLGRFLPRLGPLLHQKRPFFLWVLCLHFKRVKKRSEDSALDMLEAVRSRSAT